MQNSKTSIHRLRMNGRMRFFCYIFISFLAFIHPAFAFSVQVQSRYKNEQNVVVILYPIGQTTLDDRKSNAQRKLIIQENKLFDPFVTVVQTGTTISFPNKDVTRHHVYSFSDAKQFQLPLYLGKSKDVLFDRPGIVSIGCNIHDWMLAYIVITDSPYYGVSDKDGLVDLSHLPPGQYSLRYWYPGLSTTQSFIGVEGIIHIALIPQEPYRLFIGSPNIKERPDAMDDDGADNW